MSVGSGIGGQCGLAKETTYGTYAAPTAFVPASKAAFQLVKNTVQASYVGAGRLMDLGSGRRVTTTAGKGTLDLDIYNTGFGLLLRALMGNSASTSEGGSPVAYLQTHTLGDTFGQSLTAQVGIPDTSGAVHPYTFLGAKVTDATFTLESDKESTAEFNFDARQVVETQTLAAASYTTAMRPYVGTDMAVLVGATYGAEASVNGVRKVVLKVDRKLAIDRFYAGGAGLHDEPIISDFADLSGTITADNVDKTVFADRFASDAGFSLRVDLTGLVISGSNNFRFSLILPQCFLDGDTPVLDGPGIVSGDFAYTAKFDGTNLPRIEYMTTDATIG